ncbi:MAG TPA: hypothetical protein VM802_16215 [Chitinophaga sp.]|uniref:hypothetical protein n=1 Tax=Chitinophaga sp. TaxID=1869181 RepID=UPI002CB9A87C|nr:hypothetical protein [Chitinophaga sp.]HVI46421.1 hypothetical protein [Chitinophaga sp.]
MYSKMIIPLLAAIGFNMVSQAQDKSQGIVKYDVTLFLHASLKPDQQQFKDMIPETAVNKETLYYNGNKTKVTLKDPDEIESEEGAHVKIKMGNDNEEAVYTDGSTNESYVLKNEEGKKYLEKVSRKKNDLGKPNGDVKGIQDSVFVNAAMDKSSSRTKEILGYTCKERVIKGKGEKITLWVTTDLPFKGGPMHMYSPEGAVLGVESNKFKAIATSIDNVPVKPEEVALPQNIPVK